MIELTLKEAEQCLDMLGNVAQATIKCGRSKTINGQEDWRMHTISHHLVGILSQKIWHEKVLEGNHEDY